HFEDQQLLSLGVQVECTVVVLPALDDRARLVIAVITAVDGILLIDAFEVLLQFLVAVVELCAKEARNEEEDVTKEAPDLGQSTGALNSQREATSRRLLNYVRQLMSEEPQSIRRTRIVFADAKY